MIPFQSFGNKLKWKFEQISSLQKEERFRDVFSIGPTSWKISICKHSFYLSIYIHYESENKNEKNWFCETETTFKILRQSGTEKNTEKMKSDAFHSTKLLSLGYRGFPCSINNFVENDSIIVEFDLDFVYHDFSKKIENITDIVVNVEHTEFHLNKGVLCSKSKYFYDLFLNQPHEKNVLKLSNLTAKDLCYILIPFNPNFNIIQQNTCEYLIKIAKDFGVRSLHQLCEQFLVTNHGDRATFTNIKISDENDYELLMKKSIESLKSIEDVRNIQVDPVFSKLKETTKLRVMMRCLDFL